MMTWEDDIRRCFPEWGTEAALNRWPEDRSRLAVGQVVRGIVIAHSPFGIWMDISAGHPAVLLEPGIIGSTVLAESPAIGVTLEATIAGLGNEGEIVLSQTDTKQRLAIAFAD